MAITEHAFSHPISEQHDALRRSTEIQGRLEWLVLEARGLGEVMRMVAEAIGGGACVLSGRGETIAVGGTSRRTSSTRRDGRPPPTAPWRRRSAVARSSSPSSAASVLRCRRGWRAWPDGRPWRSFHEARCALEAVRFADGDAPEVASHRDLGSFYLLLSLQDDEALRSYCDSVLGTA